MKQGGFLRSTRHAKLDFKEGCPLSSLYLNPTNPLSTLYLVRDHHAVSITMVGSSQGAAIT
jgi:hypothetical protein